MAYAMVSTVRPNASATPSRPMPTLGNAAARTALPHPPRTSQNVPMNSADSFETTTHSFCSIGRTLLELRHDAGVLPLRMFDMLRPDDEPLGGGADEVEGIAGDQR